MSLWWVAMSGTGWFITIATTITEVSTTAERRITRLGEGGSERERGGEGGTMELGEICVTCQGDDDSWIFVLCVVVAGNRACTFAMLFLLPSHKNS